MNAQEQQKIIDVYQQLYKIHGPTAKALAWRDKLSQQVRFQVLTEIIDDINNFNGKSILDVGCGLGDLYYYFQEKKINVQYTGIDLVDDFIAYAQKKYPVAKFLLGNYLTIKLSKFDYIFASGIFNFSLEDNFELLKETLKKMVKETKCGIAFNFLTAFHTQKEKDLYYFYPTDVLKIALEQKNISGAAMRLDYELVHNLNDGTIYLYKK